MSIKLIFSTLLIMGSLCEPIGVFAAMSSGQRSSLIAQQPAPNKASNDTANQALNRGIQQFEARQFLAAQQSFQEALNQFQQQGNNAQTARTLNHLSDLHASWDLGDSDLALETSQQALTLARQVNDRSLEATALARIARAQNRLGFYAKTIEAAQASLVILRDHPDTDTEARALISLSYAYASLNDKSKALDYAQQAVTVAQTHHDRTLEVKALTSLGDVYRYQQQDDDKAMATYQQALKIAISAGDINGQLDWVLPSIYTLYGKLKQNEPAIAYRQQRLKLAQQVGDRTIEAFTLQDLGNTYNAISQPDRALEFYQQSLVVAKQSQNPQLEVAVVANIGSFYRDRRDFVKAFEYYQQALALSQQLQQPKKVMVMLQTIGDIHKSLNDYPKAIDAYQQALTIARTLKKRKSEGSILNAIANTYYSQRNYQQAIGFYQQALPIFKELELLQDVSVLLTNIGDAYGELKDYPRKVEYYQQAIVVDRAMNNANYEVVDLINLAAVYVENLNDRPTAITTYQQALKIAQDSGDRNFERTTLMSLGNAYTIKLRDIPQGTAYHQQALAIARAQNRPDLASTLIDLAATYVQQGAFGQAKAWATEGLTLAQQASDLKLQGWALAFLGLTYNQQGEFQTAIHYFQQALPIARRTQNRGLEQIILVGLGGAYTIGESRYPEGLDLLQQGLTLARELRDRFQESLALTLLSMTYQQTNDYTQAIALAQQSLTISREIGNDQAELFALFSLSGVYEALGDDAKATEYNQHVLALSRKTNQPLMEGLALLLLAIDAQQQDQFDQAIDLAQQATNIFKDSPLLNSIGVSLLADVQTDKGDYQTAIALRQQSLATAQTLKVASFISSNWLGLGYTYRKAGQYQQAIAAYQEALATNPTPEIPGSNTGAYAGLARTYRSLDQPTVAIAYYKQAVDRVEEFRRTIVGLPPELQLSFLQSGGEEGKPVEIYRELADLLLAEGRVAEAQTVLELVKAQEIKDFRRGGDTIAAAPTAPSTFAPAEADILKQHGTLIAFGRRVAECKLSNCAQLPQLNTQLQSLNDQYFNSIEGLQQAFFDRKDTALLNPRSLNSMKEIVEAQPGTVLIYPFVTDDKIWLIWATQGGVVRSIEVPVSKAQLQTTVEKLRLAISDADTTSSDYQPLGKQLYDWLVKPLEPELQKNNVQNLVFSLDGSTRYIPMAALYDGNKHLIETYTVSVVLSADKTDMRDRLPADPQAVSVVALGASKFQEFGALPYVSEEVDAIVRRSPTDKTGIFPGLIFLDQQFDLPALRDHLAKGKILHIATHAKFERGQPEASFLVLGTGEKYTLRKIQSLPDLDRVHLVVLSACQTAAGGKDHDGVEIAGISSYFLEGGAKAVLASLWSVDDESTSSLMQVFYQTLAKSTAKVPVTKAASLRQAQLHLLQGKAGQEFSHPRYWAPFVLIGNNL